MKELEFDIRELQGIAELALTEKLNCIVWGKTTRPTIKIYFAPFKTKGAC
jgi:hypothetical protein